MKTLSTEVTANFSLLPFQNLIITCLSAPIYKVRGMASKALYLILASQDITAGLDHLVEMLGVKMNNNLIHGVLLIILTILRHHDLKTEAGKKERNSQ